MKNFRHSVSRFFIPLMLVFLTPAQVVLLHQESLMRNPEAVLGLLGFVGVVVVMTQSLHMFFGFKIYREVERANTAHREEQLTLLWMTFLQTMTYSIVTIWVVLTRATLGNQFVWMDQAIVICSFIPQAIFFLYLYGYIPEEIFNHQDVVKAFRNGVELVKNAHRNAERRVGKFVSNTSLAMIDRLCAEIAALQAGDDSLSLVEQYTVDAYQRQYTEAVAFYAEEQRRLEQVVRDAQSNAKADAAASLETLQKENRQLTSEITTLRDLVGQEKGQLQKLAEASSTLVNASLALRQKQEIKEKNKLIAKYEEMIAMMESSLVIVQEAVTDLLSS